MNKLLKRKVSLFDSLKTSDDPDKIELDDLLWVIGHPKEAGKEYPQIKKWVKVVNKLRDLAEEGGERNKAKIGDLKRNNLGYVTLSGTFSYRDKDHLENYNGLIQLDIDKGITKENFSDVWKVVAKCPHVLAVFRSPTGKIKGIGVGPKDHTQHLRAFAAFEKYFADRAIKLDPSTKDIARACLLTFDEEIFINQNATPIEPMEIVERVACDPSSYNGVDQKHSHRETPIPVDHLRSILKAISDQWNGKEDRDGWIQICGATLDACCGDVSVAAGLLEEYLPSSRKSDTAYTFLMDSGISAVPWETIRTHIPKDSGLHPLPLEERHSKILQSVTGKKHDQIFTNVFDLEEIETDSGFSKSIIIKHFSDLFRYNVDSKEFLVREDHLWVPDNGMLMHLCAELREGAEAMVLEWWGQQDQDNDRMKAKKKFLMTQAKSLGSVDKLKRALKMASVNPALAVKDKDFDSDPWIIAAQNGIIDLRLGKMSENYDGYVKNSLAVNFDPDATCEGWRRFMSEIMDDDEEMVEYLQRLIGCSMTGLVRDETLTFLLGVGSNGKSTFTETIDHVMGTYSHLAPPTLWAKTKGDQPKNDIADLQGKRFVLSSETGKGSTLADDQMKRLTGSKISGRQLYGKQLSFTNTSHLFIEGNNKPRIQDATDGTWRRLALIDFPRRFSLAERDEGLKARLLEEAPGILNWMIEGCLAWQRNSLSNRPAKVEESVSEYRADEDELGGFIAAKFDNQEGGFVSNEIMWNLYLDWCDSQGRDRRKMKNQLFKELREKGIEKGRKKNTRGWKNLKPKAGIENEKNIHSHPFFKGVKKNEKMKFIQ